jgi:hypothetical protein
MDHGPAPDSRSSDRRASATRPSRHARLEIVATRVVGEQPERWAIAMTMDDRTIDVGEFPSIAKALMTGLRVYYESTLPPQFRRRHKDILDDEVP